jgi:hypothetical protein
VREVICSQEEGQIALVLEKKEVESVMWMQFTWDWLRVKDSNGCDCYEKLTDVIAQKFWVTEVDIRHRLSAAVTVMLTRTHGLMSARRTARQMREHIVLTPLGGTV